MLQEQRAPWTFRRYPFRRRSVKSRADRDDRGWATTWKGDWTLLHIEAQKGDLKAVKQLIDEGMDVNVSARGPDSKGLTALHLAAGEGHIAVMDELLESGADIDARAWWLHGWAPLHLAATKRNREAVKFLLEKGAFLADDINDSRFNPPLQYCPGLELAYEEMRKLQGDTPPYAEDTSCGSGN